MIFQEIFPCVPHSNFKYDKALKQLVYRNNPILQTKVCNEMLYTVKWLCYGWWEKNAKLIKAGKHFMTDVLLKLIMLLMSQHILIIV